MPLVWKRRINPYLHTYFSILGVGPNPPKEQILALAVQRIKRIQIHEIKLGDVLLKEHDISNAKECLLNDRSRVEELVWVHQEETGKKHSIKQVQKEIKAIATPPEPEPIPLRHSLAIFCFVQPPHEDVIASPEWHEFNLVVAGDPEDEILDVIFDL